MKRVIKRQDFASPLIQNLSITSFLLTKVLTLTRIKYIFYRISSEVFDKGFKYGDI